MRSQAWEAKPLKPLNSSFRDHLSVNGHQIWNGLGRLVIVVLMVVSFLLIAAAFHALPSRSLSFF